MDPARLSDQSLWIQKCSAAFCPGHQVAALSDRAYPVEAAEIQRENMEAYNRVKAFFGNMSNSFGKDVCLEGFVRLPTGLYDFDHLAGFQGLAWVDSIEERKLRYVDSGIRK